jgi:lipopolysaccharide export system permease protein
VSGTGLSPFQISRPFLFGAFIIGVVASCVINPYSVNLTTKNLTNNQLKLVDNAIWLREISTDRYLTARAEGLHVAQNKDIIFENITVLIQDKNFKLQERVTAQSATLSNDGIDIEMAQITTADGISKKEPRHIDTQLTPVTVLDRYLQPDQISFWKLPAFMKKMNEIGVPTRGHRVQFWTLFFLPLNMIAMVALGIAFSQTRQRRNYTFGLKFSLGILTCFALYFIVNLFNALGNTGALPPLIAIIAPRIIIIAGACMFITSFDSI